MGLGEQLVGVSHSCRFPAPVASLPKMTRTHVPFDQDSITIDAYVREHLTGHEALYELELDRLEAAKPDVVISQALCDVCAVATGDVTEAIRSLPGQPRLIDLTPNTLDDVFDDIFRVGIELGAGAAAVELLNTLRERRDRIASRTATIPDSDRPRVAFLEWLLPPFNGGHWNPELVTLAGGVDLLGAHGKPSSTQRWSGLVELKPEVLFIACCGFTIDRAMDDVRAVSRNEAWHELPAVRDDRVYLTDGNAYFSSPGPRLIDGLEIMAHVLHTTVHTAPYAGKDSWTRILSGNVQESGQSRVS